MLKAFEDGLDIHTSTLAYMEGLTYEETVDRVNSSDTWYKKRREAKTGNFLILYGGTAYRLLKTLLPLGINKSIASCQEFMDDWFNTYSGVAKYISEVESFIQDNNYSESILGRKLFIPPSSKYWEEAGNLRKGVNFTIQSLASDITMASLICLDESGIDSCLTVHDSILGQYSSTTPSNFIEQRVRHIMTSKTKGKIQDLFGVDLPSMVFAVDVDSGLERWK